MSDQAEGEEQSDATGKMRRCSRALNPSDRRDASGEAECAIAGEPDAATAIVHAEPA